MTDRPPPPPGLHRSPPPRSRPPLPPRPPPSAPQTAAPSTASKPCSRISQPSPETASASAMPCPLSSSLAPPRSSNEPSTASAFPSPCRQSQAQTSPLPNGRSMTYVHTQTEVRLSARTYFWHRGLIPPLLSPEPIGRGPAPRPTDTAP